MKNRILCAFKKTQLVLGITFRSGNFNQTHRLQGCNVGESQFEMGLD